MPTGSSFYAKLGKLSAIIMILPASMGAGWLMGYCLVDHFLDTFPLGSILLTLGGAGAGFYEIVKILYAGEKGRDGSR